MDSANVLTPLLSPNLHSVMIHLGGYSGSVCTYPYSLSCV